MIKFDLEKMPEREQKILALLAFIKSNIFKPQKVEQFKKQLLELGYYSKVEL